MDRDTGSLYICIDADILEKKYAWRIVGDADAIAVQQAVKVYLEENPVLGGGLTSTAATLLISILENAVFTSDQSDTIKALAEALAVSKPDEPVIPDDPDTPDTVTYTVTNNLTNVTTSNAAASVTGGAGYAATLTAADGYMLDSVTVTMGGVDITSTVYLDGSVSIATVSGDIVITATANYIPVYEPVELVNSTTGYSATLYSDDGVTGVGDNGTAYCDFSEEVFAEDTEVIVSFTLTGTLGARKAYAGCVPADFVPNGTGAVAFTAYYTELLGTLDSVQNVKYTVKAGYKLALMQRGANSQGTFSAAKGV